MGSLYRHIVTYRCPECGAWWAEGPLRPRKRYWLCPSDGAEGVVMNYESANQSALLRAVTAVRLRRLPSPSGRDAA